MPIVVINASELNAFFLKFVLWVPPRNPLNTYRILIWFGAPAVPLSRPPLPEPPHARRPPAPLRAAAMAMPATKEYYEFITLQRGSRFRKLGTFAWLSLACAALEALVILKFSRGMFVDSGMPRDALWIWGCILGGVIVTFSSMIKSRRFRGPHRGEADYHDSGEDLHVE